MEDDLRYNHPLPSVSICYVTLSYKITITAVKDSACWSSTVTAVNNTIRTSLDNVTSDD